MIKKTMMLLLVLSVVPSVVMGAERKELPRRQPNPTSGEEGPGVECPTCASTNDAGVASCRLCDSALPTLPTTPATHEERVQMSPPAVSRSGSKSGVDQSSRKDKIAALNQLLHSRPDLLDYYSYTSVPLDGYLARNIADFYDAAYRSVKAISVSNRSLSREGYSFLGTMLFEQFDSQAYASLVKDYVAFEILCFRPFIESLIPSYQAIENRFGRPQLMNKVFSALLKKTDNGGLAIKNIHEKFELREVHASLLANLHRVDSLFFTEESRIISRPEGSTPGASASPSAALSLYSDDAAGGATASASSSNEPSLYPDLAAGGTAAAAAATLTGFLVNATITNLAKKRALMLLEGKDTAAIDARLKKLRSSRFFKIGGAAVGAGLLTGGVTAFARRRRK